LFFNTLGFLNGKYSGISPIISASIEPELQDPSRGFKIHIGGPSLTEKDLQKYVVDWDKNKPNITKAMVKNLKAYFTGIGGT
jgi:hypothetical protein